MSYQEINEQNALYEVDVDDEFILVQEEKEKYHPIMFNLLGITSLLPFNCIIVPVEFWMKFYPLSFLSIASTSYNVTNWATMIFMILKGCEFKPNSLVNFALSVILVTLVFIPLIEPIFKDEVTAKVIITLIPILLIGVGNAALTPTLFSIASRLNQKNNAAIMAGEGIAGILTEVIYIIVKACISGFDPETKQYEDALFWSTVVYFAVAGSFAVASFFIWKHLYKEYQGIIHTTSSTAFSKDSLMRIWSLTKVIVIPAFSVFFNFLVTLSIFPCITVLIPYNSLGRKNELGEDNGWYNVGFMSIFMLFDWVGRESSSIQWLSDRISLKIGLLFILFRVIFYIFFPMEALPKYAYDEFYDVIEHPLINSDTISCLTMIVFAFSNGLLSSIAMMKYSSLITEIDDLTLAGNIETFCLNSGLLAGGLISLGISAALE